MIAHTAYMFVFSKRLKSFFLTALFFTFHLFIKGQVVVWEENFNGTTLNAQNWVYEIGDGCNEGICGWGNFELEYYTSRNENVRIENGNLIIEARREIFGTKEFTSGRIKTKGKMHFKYGTLEARIKITDLKNGLWPAFWTLGAVGLWPASGEIDVLEMGMAASYPDNVNNWVSAAAHWEHQDTQADYSLTYQSPTSLTNDYHVYKLVWDPAYIRVYIDNIQFYEINILNGAPADLEEFHQPHYILLNLAVGGSFTAITTPSGVTAPMPAQMFVDYIKLTQTPGDEIVFPFFINTENISPISFCAGSTLNVSYSTNGNFNAGNIFSVELSNAAGSFSSPVNIGSMASTSASGTINVTIPFNTPSGNYYRIRINSNTPGITGNASNSLTINSTPPTPTITAGTTTFCTGGNVTLTSNAASGNQWYKDGVAISGSTATTLNVTASGSYTTKITLSGCESVPSNAIVVTENPIPSTPTITAGTATTFCTGGSVTLTSNAASGNQWYKDGVAIIGSTATTLNVTASGGYTTKITLGGCESSASNALVVTVNPIPSAPTITGGTSTTFCIGGNVIFTSNAANNNQWYNGAAAIAGATNSTYTVTDAGNYSVKVTQNGCTSPNSNVLTVTVNPLPAAPVVSWNGTQLNTTSGFAAHQWFLNGGTIAGATSSSHTPTSSGLYKVRITDGNGCMSTSAEFNLVATGINDVLLNGVLYSISPNPADNELYLKVQGNNPDKLQMRIINPNGAEVMRREGINQTFAIPVRHLPSGTYFIILSSKKERATFKIIIKHL